MKAKVAAETVRTCMSEAKVSAVGPFVNITSGSTPGHQILYATSLMTT